MGNSMTAVLVITAASILVYMTAWFIAAQIHSAKAGVPDDLEFKTKSQLALEMVRSARARGIRFAWVGVGAGYGKETDFLSALNDEGEIFMADVHKDQVISIFSRFCLKGQCRPLNQSESCSESRPITSPRRSRFIPIALLYHASRPTVSSKQSNGIYLENQ
jgi:hypothetical protein